MKQLAPDSPCPCGGVVGGGESTAAAHPMRKASAKSASTLTYGQCCGRWLEAGARRVYLLTCAATLGGLTDN